jgi:hypothetical protein
MWGLPAPPAPLTTVVTYSTSGQGVAGATGRSELRPSPLAPSSSARLGAGLRQRYPGRKPLLRGVEFERDKVIRYQAFMGGSEALEATGLRG